MTVSLAYDPPALYPPVQEITISDSKEERMHWRVRVIRRTALLCTLGALFGITEWSQSAYGWPAAPLQNRNKDCAVCHTSTNAWMDTSKLIIDIVDTKTGKSLKTANGSFEIPVKRGSELRVNSVLGVKPGYRFPPEKVGWLYVSPEALQSAQESDPKFAPGWQVNRAFCMKRLVEKIDGFPGNQLAAVTMTVRPLEGAEDATVSLQVLLKSSGRGLVGEYFESTVHLRVVD
jgi:hypothetical protein